MSAGTIVTRAWRFAAVAVTCLAGWNGTAAAPFPDPRSEQGLIAAPDAAFMAEALDPACFAPTLVSTGGAFPRNARTLAIRWTGFANFELVAVSAAFVQALVVEQALEHLRTYRPDVFIPAHHDAALNGLWRPTEPLFLAMKSEKPDLVTVSKGYREPVCFNTEDNVQRRGKK